MRHLAAALIVASFVAADVVADLRMGASDNRGWDISLTIVMVLVAVWWWREDRRPRGL